MRLEGLERRVLAAAASGEWVDLGRGPFTADQMQGWPPERTVRALVLRALLTEPYWPVQAKGIRLRGLRISGPLDLTEATVRCSLQLEDCYLDAPEPLCFDHATALHLALTGCWLGGLSAEMLVARELDLRNSCLAGPLRLLGASIAGQIICRGAQLTGRDEAGDALIADGVQTGGSVFLDTDLGTGRRFTAAGGVRFVNAQIGRQFYCRGAQLQGNDAGQALTADGLKAGSGVILNHGFAAAGTVRLANADITGQLSCRDATLAEGATGSSALMGNGIKVSADLLLDGEFAATGAVRLAGADVGGKLRCAGTLTSTANGIALVADAARVADGVFFEPALAVAGTISLESAVITGPLSVHGSLAAGPGQTVLDATGMQVTGTLDWAPAAAVTGAVDLDGASAGQLDDAWTDTTRPANGYWPQNGRLNLRGFTYSRLGGDNPATPADRLSWIRSQYTEAGKGAQTGFATQPYEQLAAVWRSAGEDTAARRAAVARRRDLRSYGDLAWHRWIANWLLDATIRYGYSTWRAGLGLIIVFGLFTGLAYAAQQDHRVVPTGSVSSLSPAPTALSCTSTYPCFYPVGYAIDTVIPVIDVHQAASWGLDGNRPWGWAWVAAAWLATALGWAMATLLIAGYTGLVRQP